MSSGHLYPWHRWVGLAIVLFSLALLVTFFCAIGETNAARQALDNDAATRCVRSVPGYDPTDLYFSDRARYVGTNTIEASIMDVDRIDPADRPPSDRVRCRIRFERNDNDDPEVSVVSAEWVR